MGVSVTARALALPLIALAMAGCSFLPQSGGGPQRAVVPAIARAENGNWSVTTPRYSASISRDGYLTSLKVGAVETVGAFAYQPRAKLAADKIEAEADTLKVHLKNQGEATVDYRFRRDGVTITPTWRGGGYAEFQLTASPAVLGIELLNDKSVTVGADAMRFVDRSEVRGVPAAPSSRNQMVRFHFPGLGLHAYVQAWGCPYTYESAGFIRDRRWGRSLMEANKAFPIILTIQPRSDQAALAAVPFVPRTDKPQKEPDWVKVAGAAPPVWMHVKRLDELFDRAASESKRYGLRWFFQANSRPSYATPAVYEAMAYALVSRYKDRCTHWEVENEPNFGYTLENYVKQCVIPFAKGAKRADPNCAIMGPGGCGVRDTLRFMEHIYATGTHKWFDEITTHSYPGPGEPWGRFGNVAMIEKLREWMKAHGDDGKPLWQTEQGYRWQLSPKGEAARYAVRQFLQAWRLGIAPSRHYYFYPQSHGFESWYQTGGGEAGSEKSWLPIAAAQRFLAENTHKMEFTGDVPTPYKGIYLARLTGAEGDVVAAWTFDFAFTLRAKAPGLRRVVGYRAIRSPSSAVPAASSRCRCQASRSTCIWRRAARSAWWTGPSAGTSRQPPRVPLLRPRHPSQSTLPPSPTTATGSCGRTRQSCPAARRG